jgi:hypothetical protein
VSAQANVVKLYTGTKREEEVFGVGFEADSGDMDIIHRFRIYYMLMFSPWTIKYMSSG